MRVRGTVEQRVARGKKRGEATGRSSAKMRYLRGLFLDLARFQRLVRSAKNGA